MTNFAIIARGTPSEKIIFENNGKAANSSSLLVTPFAGGTNSSFGVGIEFADGKRWHWGLYHPRLLVQSWRAMKLLELTPQIAPGNLCGAWSSASHELSSMDRTFIRELSERFPDIASFSKARDSVLSAVPTAGELESMLQVVLDKGIEIRDLDKSKFDRDAILASLIDGIRGRDAKEAKTTVEAAMAQDFGASGRQLASRSWNPIRAIANLVLRGKAPARTANA